MQSRLGHALDIYIYHIYTCVSVSYNGSWYVFTCFSVRGVVPTAVHNGVHAGVVYVSIYITYTRVSPLAGLFQGPYTSAFVCIHVAQWFVLKAYQNCLFMAGGFV